MEPTTSVSLRDVDWARVVAALLATGRDELAERVRSDIIEAWRQEGTE